AFNNAFPKEKLYLSLDKPYYNVGDTLWFKSFLLNGALKQNTQTDKIYVELFNDSSKLVESKAIALNNGLGYGDFALDKKLNAGTYTLRAYTNWQQNFGSDYFFQKSIYVGNVGAKTWLVDSFQKLSNAASNTILDLKIRLTNINNEPAAMRDVEVYLMNDNKRLMKADLQTSLDGKIETSIPLSDQINGNYSFYIVDKKDRAKKAIIPILLQDVDEIDLQFMPEGGYLVNAIYSKVAFKAIGPDGMGRSVNGKIVNSKNEKVAEFNAQHKGMGNFFLLAQKGESYSAIYTINGKEKRKALPIAKPEGTTLRIDHLSKPDSLLIYIKASETKRVDQSYQLVAQSADQLILSTAISLKNGFSTLKLAKKDFTDGITHFTLFDPDNLPINERSVFINHKQHIKLNVSTPQSSYQLRDSIVVEINATNEEGLPLSGTFSVSVTDNNQVKQEQNEENIISHFLLQSDIKGNIEEAGWYFADQKPATLLELDNLLLTQAWIGYQWNKINKPREIPKFKAEKDNLIEGRVEGLLNKPMPNIDMKLLSLGKSLFFADTLTNAEGRFVFRNIPLLDSAAYTIKIKNAKGKTAAGTIFVDEFAPSKLPFNVKLIKPWYVNADSTSLNFFQNIEKQKKPIDPARITSEGIALKEVEIKNSKKLNDYVELTAWDANLFKRITEEELKKIPNKTLYDLLKEKIEGFTIGDFYSDGCFGEAARPRKHSFVNYLIGSQIINIITIDKINTVIVAGYQEQYQENVSNISTTAIQADIFLTNSSILNILSASDVKDIIVYKGCNGYFLDITTRSGKGPWVSSPKGSYVFRPIPIYRSKDFYSPKYTVDKNS
ncbi:hypothetical protein WG904_19550, partial [Pedobacter sp. Du54]|uniref:hypothetical protein n=1 Tax=Pedobacter anseongensis TaxID=3133439 RepID=UPI0030ACCB4E